MVFISPNVVGDSYLERYWKGKKRDRGDFFINTDTRARTNAFCYLIDGINVDVDMIGSLK